MNLTGDCPANVPVTPKVAAWALADPRVPADVPALTTAETLVPAVLMAPATFPRPTDVGTELPFWIREIIGVLEAQGELDFTVTGLRLSGDEALRGQAAISASGFQNLLQAFTVRAQALLDVRPGADAGTMYLRAQAAISAAVSAVLPAGTRTLAGQAGVSFGSLVRSLLAAFTLGGRGAITVPSRGMDLGAGTRTWAGRGAVTFGSVGQTLVIPTIRMYKTNTQGGTGTSYFTLTGMVADPAYPASEVDNSSALSVPDNWPSYTATVRAEVPHTGGTVPRYGQAQIYKSGTLMATGAQSSGSPDTSVVEWTGTVNAGDYFVISWRGEGNFFNRPTAQAGAFLRVVPQ